MRSLVIFTSAAEEMRNEFGIAPMGAAFIFLDHRAPNWLCGADKDTQLMTARAAAIAATEHLESHGDHATGLVFISENNGWQRFFLDYVPVWIRDGTIKKKHGGCDWTEAYLLTALTDAEYLPPKPDQRCAVSEITTFAKMEVRDRARRVFRGLPQPVRSIGIFDQGVSWLRRPGENA